MSQRSILWRNCFDGDFETKLTYNNTNCYSFVIKPYSVIVCFKTLSSQNILRRSMIFDYAGKLVAFLQRSSLSDRICLSLQNVREKSNLDSISLWNWRIGILHIQSKQSVYVVFHTYFLLLLHKVWVVYSQFRSIEYYWFIHISIARPSQNPLSSRWVCCHAPSTSDNTSKFRESYCLPQVDVEYFHFLNISSRYPNYWFYKFGQPHCVVSLLHPESNIRCHIVATVC
jgi:hypothetical protein